LHVAAELVGNTLVIRLHGELDMYTAEEFKHEAERHLMDLRVKNLVLVLSKTSLIDSSGVGAILGRYRTIQQRGGTMIAVGLRPVVKRILKLSGVLGVVETAESERRALARL
jgi:stage II sporulation protein AA (anti-sigma F factor antagonist)